MDRATRRGWPELRQHVAAAKLLLSAQIYVGRLYWRPFALQAIAAAARVVEIIGGSKVTCKLKRFLLTGLSAVTLAASVNGFTDTAFADSGAYLASRQASIDSNFDALAQFAMKALVATPNDPALLEAMITANIARGDFDAIKGYATMLEAADPGSQLASLARLVNLARDEDYDGILSAFEDGLSVSDVIDQFVHAWALVGRGELSKAVEAFDEAAQSGTSSEFFGPYNKALAIGLAGDFETAEAILASDATPDTRDALTARIQMLSQLDRNDEALALIEKFFSDSSDPEIDDFEARLRAGEALHFSEIRSAKDGMSEVFYSVAVALSNGPNPAYTLMFARSALALRPERAQNVLLTAELLQSLGNYALAEAAYDTMPHEDPSYHLAELGRASVLDADGREEAALEVLKSLAERKAEHSEVHVALGDAMRRDENFEGAIAAYSTAISQVGEPTRVHWPLFFTRGIAYERIDSWPEAEADFRQALALEPGQPSVLNYLGYSFLEMQTNLDEAMDLIREAAAARPDSGYITDSLAWGLYRLGRYDEALEPMERAAELMPHDPIVSDHLGDVYWAVGREREAVFQWNRALSFEPEDQEADRIRRKLDVGLDAVLIEEGLEPTRPQETP